LSRTHIKKCHRKPASLCFTCYGVVPDLVKHGEENSCRRGARRFEERITQAKFESLLHKHPGDAETRKSQEKRWFSMYSSLFSTADLPSSACKFHINECCRAMALRVYFTDQTGIEAHLIRDFQAHVHRTQASIVAEWDGVSREELSRLLDIAVNRGIEDILSQSQQLGENPPTQPQNHGTGIASDHDLQVPARAGAGTISNYEHMVPAPQVSSDSYPPQIQESQVRERIREGIMEPLSSQVYPGLDVSQEQNASMHPPSQYTSVDERMQSAGLIDIPSDTPSIQSLQHQDGLPGSQGMNMPGPSLPDLEPSESYFNDAMPQMEDWERLGI
jgi:hypothetical protein